MLKSISHIFHFFHRHSSAWLSLYGLISLWGYFYYFHVITQPDTFNYLLISEDFLNGRFWEGVNSMWGSLITVLVLPFMALGMDGVIAFKLVQILISLLVLRLFLLFLKRLKLSPLQEGLAVIPILPMLLLASLILTPDLLLLGMTMYYIFIVSKPDFFSDKIPIGRHIQQGLWLGLIGGMMYWSKSYGLPFFVAHFSLLCFGACIFSFWKFKNYKRITIVLKKYVSAMLVFILLAGLWMSAISLKTGQFTFGTAGKYNIALKGNVMNGVHLTKDQLHNPQTLYTKYWIYHEAGLFVDAWSPFASKENTQYFIKNIFRNLSSLSYVVFIRDVLILMFLLGLVSLNQATERSRNKKVAERSRSQLFVFITAILLYTGGYLLVFIQPRYLWIDYILLWLMFWMLVKCLDGKLLNICLLLSCLIMSINTIDRLRMMTVDRDFFESVNIISKDLEKLDLEDKNIAANHPAGNLISVDADIYLLYRHKFRYWGQVSDKRLNDEGLNTANMEHIDYFFCWDNPEYEQELFKERQLVFRSKSAHLGVYRLK